MTDSRILKYPFNTEDDNAFESYRNSYQVNFYCSNCGHYDFFRLPKGVAKKNIKIDCDNCGCEGCL